MPIPIGCSRRAVLFLALEAALPDTSTRSLGASTLISMLLLHRATRSLLGHQTLAPSSSQAVFTSGRPMGSLREHETAEAPHLDRVRRLVKGRTRWGVDPALAQLFWEIDVKRFAPTHAQRSDSGASFES